MGTNPVWSMISKIIKLMKIVIKQNLNILSDLAEVSYNKES